MGERKPLVYVAGPMSADPFGCVRRALPVFDALRSAGCVPFLPQLSIVAEIARDGDYEDWLAYDFDMIDRCDALVRLPGASKGADREVAYAAEQGIPILMGLAVDELVWTLPGWAKHWTVRG